MPTAKWCCWAYAPGDPGTAGIDTLEDLAAVPASFRGYLWTNRIELIAGGEGAEQLRIQRKSTRRDARPVV